MPYALMSSLYQLGLMSFLCQLWLFSLRMHAVEGHGQKVYLSNVFVLFLSLFVTESRVMICHL